MVDQYTELVNTMALPNLTLLYRYRLQTEDGYEKRELVRYIKSDLKKAGARMNCTSPDTKQMLDAGITMRYDYHDVNMTFVASISMSEVDCRLLPK